MTSHPRRVQSSTAREKNGVLWTISPFPNISGDISPSASCCCCSDSKGKSISLCPVILPYLQTQWYYSVKGKAKDNMTAAFWREYKISAPRVKVLLHENVRWQSIPRILPPKRLTSLPRGIFHEFEGNLGYMVSSSQRELQNEILSQNPTQPTNQSLKAVLKRSVLHR